MQDSCASGNNTRHARVRASLSFSRKKEMGRGEERFRIDGEWKGREKLFVFAAIKGIEDVSYGDDKGR